jgi:hypothetical protein
MGVSRYSCIIEYLYYNIPNTGGLLAGLFRPPMLTPLSSLFTGQSRLPSRHRSAADLRAGGFREASREALLRDQPHCATPQTRVCGVTFFYRRSCSHSFTEERVLVPLVPRFTRCISACPAPSRSASEERIFVSIRSSFSCAQAASSRLGRAADESRGALPRDKSLRRFHPLSSSRQGGDVPFLT